MNLQATAGEFSPFVSRRLKITRRRIVIALIIVIALHLFFFLEIAPLLELDRGPSRPTEVVQISSDELAKLKRQILNKQKSPLLKQEVLEQYKVNEPPPDAKMIGPINQRVPKEMVAGPQHEEPLDGGGSKAKTQAQTQKQKPIDLSKLGMGSKLPKSRPQDFTNEQTSPGPQGAPGPYRPMGRSDSEIEKGDQNLLNSVESEFYSFFVRLEEPIVRNWYFLMRSNEQRYQQEIVARKIKVGMELIIGLEFVIDRQGNFKSIDIIQSSGIPTIDWATKEAVKKLGNIANPPPGLFEGGQYYTRRLVFGVHITEAPVFSGRPDMYW